MFWEKVNINCVEINDNIIYIVFLITSLIITQINFFLYMSDFSYIFVLIQISIVLLLLGLKNLFASFMIHMIFTLTSLEYPLDLGLRFSHEVYTYRTIQFGGVSAVSIITFIITITFFLKSTSYRRLSIIMKTWFGRFLMINLMTGFTVGIATLLFQNSLENWFIRDFYYHLFLIANLFISFNLFKTSKKTKRIAEIGFIAILSSSSFSSILGMVFNINATRGGLVVAPVTQIIIFSPLLMFIIFFKEFQTIKVIPFFSGLVGSFIILFLYPSGKSIYMVLILVPIFLLVFLIYKKHFIVFVLVMLLFLLFLPMNYLFIQMDFYKSELFTYKYDQAQALLNISEWLNNPYVLPTSPRIRVVEFLNIYNEYLEFPLMAFLGKGFGGYFEDLRFPLTQLTLASYSETEIKMDKFSNVHESLNHVFLKFGISGIILFFAVLIDSIVKIKLSFFLLPFAVWFLLFLGFSLTLAFFGTIAYSLFLTKFMYSKIKNQ